MDTVDRALAILGLDEVPAGGDFMRPHFLATVEHLRAVRDDALEQAASRLPVLQEYAWLVREILALRSDPARSERRDRTSEELFEA